MSDFVKIGGANGSYLPLESTTTLECEWSDYYIWTHLLFMQRTSSASIVRETRALAIVSRRYRQPWIFGIYDDSFVSSHALPWNFR